MAAVVVLIAVAAMSPVMVRQVAVAVVAQDQEAAAQVILLEAHRTVEPTAGMVAQIPVVVVVEQLLPEQAAMAERAL